MNALAEAPLRAALTVAVDNDGVAVITMDVPGQSMNLATVGLGRELDAMLNRFAADAAVRGLVITSGKADFMAGGDIRSMVDSFSSLGDEASVYREIARPFTELLRRLETCGKPVVAAINGSALGAGVEIALACHYSVVADVPRLVLALPEVTIGLIPGAGGSQRLPRRIGIERALPLLLDGTRLSPAEAVRLGLIDELATPDQLLPRARAWLLDAPKARQPWDEKGYRVPGGAGFFEPRLNQLYSQNATRLSLIGQHNLPAPIALLGVVARGTALPLDAGLRLESREFTRLLRDPVSRNLMRTGFLSRGECDKLARRPVGIQPATFNRIAVVGAGLMGRGVAQVAAEAGLDVVMLDLDADKAAAARQQVADNLAKRVNKQRLDPGKREQILARIATASDYAALAGCGLAIEAVFEDRKIKAEVLRRLRAALGPEAIIASNTSALPISQLAHGLEGAQNIIGLHFFSPVDRMPLVEVISGVQTSPQTLAHSLDFVKLLRKTPIMVKDAPGFYTTRIITAYLFESVGMVGEGLPPALIDNAARQAGFGIGPLALMDDLTLDLTYHATCRRRDETGAAWREPYGFSVFQRFVAELGRKGRRYGAGFYDYAEGRRTPWAGIVQVYAPASERPAVAELKQRMLYIQALEAARAYEEGVIADAGEGDVGSVLGIGFPAYTGGVFSLIDTMGLRAFVDACERLAERHGERFRPTPWLRDRASRNQLFHSPKRSS